MGISFLNTTAIDIDHKRQIESIRKKCGHELSSHSFASMYLWQKHMALTLNLQKDFFAVKCAARGDNTWFFPCGDEKRVFDFIKEGMQESSFSLCYLRECDAKRLDAEFPGKWELRREEASDEYICDISQYIAMEGSSFHELRKKIRHIEREYEAESQVISPENITDAMSVLYKWEGQEHSTGEGNLTDEGIAEQAFGERELLDISGSILYLDGTPSAVFAGFALSDTVLDVLIGKCAPSAPGYTVYFAMREYLKQHRGNFVYCNLEEDLGIPGIRLVKNKMRPVAKNEIWEAVLK